MNLKREVDAYHSHRLSLWREEQCRRLEFKVRDLATQIYPGDDGWPDPRQVSLTAAWVRGAVESLTFGEPASSVSLPTMDELRGLAERLFPESGREATA